MTTGTVSPIRLATKGRTPAAISNEIQRRFDVTKSKANLLARDQIGTLSADLTRTRQESAGVKEYIWRSSGDERVRACHRELDGMYRMKKITAAGVWEKVDEGELTKAQALRICGPRPKES